MYNRRPSKKPLSAGAQKRAAFELAPPPPVELSPPDVPKDRPKHKFKSSVLRRPLTRIDALVLLTQALERECLKLQEQVVILKGAAEHFLVNDYDKGRQILVEGYDLVWEKDPTRKARYYSPEFKLFLVQLHRYCKTRRYNFTLELEKYGVNYQVFIKWSQLYEQKGPAGLGLEPHVNSPVEIDADQYAVIDKTGLEKWLDSQMGKHNTEWWKKAPMGAGEIENRFSAEEYLAIQRKKAEERIVVDDQPERFTPEDDDTFEDL